MPGDLTNDLKASILRDRDQAFAEAVRIAQLRDDLDVKLRLGLAAFNAASLVALLTAIGTAPDFMRTLGLVDGTAVFVLGAFSLGAILAGISAFATQNDLTRRSGSASARVSAIERRMTAIALGNQKEFDEATADDLNAFLKTVEKSYVAIIGQNFSAGCWLAGVLTPLAHYVSRLI